MSKVSKRDVMRSELIGLEVEVISSGAPAFSGVVVDETKNTFTVKRQGREVMVPKGHHEFQFTYQGEKVLLQGSEIQFRPEDRIKKIR